MSREHAVTGALLECDLGSSIAALNPTVAVGTEVGQRRQGIATDDKPGNITGDFGVCSGNNNLPCVKGVRGPWQNTSLTSRHHIPPPFMQEFQRLTADISQNQGLLDQLNRALAEMGAPVNPPCYSELLRALSSPPGQVIIASPEYFDMIGAYRNWANAYTGRPQSTLLPLHMQRNERIGIHQWGSKEYDYLAARTADMKILEDALKIVSGAPQSRNYIARIQQLNFMLLNLRSSPNFFSGVPYLLMGSVLACPEYGGMISIIHNGQLLGNNENDDELANLKERVKEVIRKHYGVGTPTVEERNRHADEAVAAAQEGADIAAVRREALNNYQTAQDRMRVELAGMLSARENSQSDAATIVNALTVQRLQEKLGAANEARDLDEIVRLNAQLGAFGNFDAITAILDSKDEILEALGDTAAGHQLRIMLHQAEAAERTIEELQIDEQEDALKLLAWLVLLNENNIWHDAAATPPFSLDNAVAAMMRDVRDVRPRHYENYGIVVAGNEDGGNEGVFILTEVVLRRRIGTCEAEAVSNTNNMGGNLRLWHPIPEKRVINQLYGDDNPSYTREIGFPHTGVDFTTNHIEGFGVYASVSGTVVDRRINQPNTWRTRTRSFGNFVQIEANNSANFLYAHLNEVTVVMGEYVLAGKNIGTSGNTGLSSHPHLHYEVRSDRASSSHISPYSYVEGR